MTKMDLNIAYNARKVVLNHAEYSGRWDVLATEYRNEVDGELDIPYGGGEREKFDFFPAGQGAPVCIYIHGGYWRSRNRKTFSHIARGLNARGISVAIPSYDLVPNVTIMHIVNQMRACVAKVWQHTNTRPVVAGNSAGGHLTAAMLATDWAAFGSVPEDVVTRAFALSGLYDLEPLVPLDINDDLRLTPEDAREVSPIHWPAPRAGLKFVAAVGAEETDVFIEQSRNLAQAWNEAGIETEFLEVPGCNHFSIVDAVASEGSMLFERLVTMVEAHAAA